MKYTSYPGGGGGGGGLGAKGGNRQMSGWTLVGAGVEPSCAPSVDTQWPRVWGIEILRHFHCRKTSHLTHRLFNGWYLHMGRTVILKALKIIFNLFSTFWQTGQCFWASPVCLSVCPYTCKKQDGTYVQVVRQNLITSQDYRRLLMAFQPNLLMTSPSGFM